MNIIEAVRGLFSITDTNMPEQPMVPVQPRKVFSMRVDRAWVHPNCDTRTVVAIPPIGYMQMPDYRDSEYLP